jgi:hypothetical protein
MNMKDLNYLNSFPEALQYAVKRCKQGTYMFHRTTYQGSEVMNAANKEMHTRTAVCPVNATMLMVKMECRCFKMQQTSAWALSNELSPRGEKEYKEVFDGINYQEFMIVVEDRDKESMGMQREATEHCGAEAYSNHSKGSDEGIVLWTMRLWIGYTQCCFM